MQPRRRPLITSDKRRTIAYARVSTEDQAREGVSLDAQETRIGAYATAMGFTIGEVVRDAGESATKFHRTESKQLLLLLRSNSIPAHSPIPQVSWLALKTD